MTPSQRLHLRAGLTAKQMPRRQEDDKNWDNTESRHQVRRGAPLKTKHITVFTPAVTNGLPRSAGAVSPGQTANKSRTPVSWRNWILQRPQTDYRRVSQVRTNLVMIYLFWSFRSVRDAEVIFHFSHLVRGGFWFVLIFFLWVLFWKCSQFWNNQLWTLVIIFLAGMSRLVLINNIKVALPSTEFPELASFA